MLVSNSLSKPQQTQVSNSVQRQQSAASEERALPQDTVTLSEQKESSAAGLVTMICGMMIGAGIATAVPVAGAAVMLGSIYAGLAMA